jgi:hypothetical protein
LYFSWEKAFEKEKRNEKTRITNFQGFIASSQPLSEREGTGEMEIFSSKHLNNFLTKSNILG